MSASCHVWLFATPWTVTRQPPLEFSKQEYWSGLPFPPPGDLSDPRIKPVSLESPAGGDWILYLCAAWCRHGDVLSFGSWLRGASAFKWPLSLCVSAGFTLQGQQHSPQPSQHRDYGSKPAGEWSPLFSKMKCHRNTNPLQLKMNK